MPEKLPDGTFSEIIDGTDYRFQLWGAEQALGIGMQLAAIISGPVEALGKSLGTADSGDELKAGPIIGALFASMGTHRKDALDVIKALATVGVECIPEGEHLRKIVFDKHFKGRLSHLRKVVTAAAEVQFGDFFGEMMGVFAAGKAKQMRHRLQSEETAASSSPA